MFVKLLLGLFVALVVIATSTHARELPTNLDFLPEDAVLAASDGPTKPKGDPLRLLDFNYLGTGYWG